MRRSLRHPAGGPITLFAFQDLIFSVTAVLLFATIWFALSTRVVRISRHDDEGDLHRRLTAETTAIVLAEVRQELAVSHVSSADAGEEALNHWARRQLAVEDPVNTLAGVRQEVQLQENAAAQSVKALQAEEAAWEELTRRLAIAEQRARASLLRTREPIPGASMVVVIVGNGVIELELADGARRSYRGDGAQLLKEWETVLTGRDATREWLWIGLKPSAGLHFDRLVAAVAAAGFRYHLEPLGEEQTVALYTRERALALLE